MKRNARLYAIFASVGMVMLILDGKTALYGAKEGLALALEVVVPSLFPFFFLSVLLSGALMSGSSPILRPLGWLFGLPESGGAFLIPGILGGYPAGAQCIAAAHDAGAVTREEGEKLLSFCNNAGPSFLFGMIGPMFPEAWMAWALWGIHLFGAVCVSRVFPVTCAGLADTALPSPAAALKKSTLLMATVCGWVVLFRVWIAFLDRWVLWLLPVEGQAVIRGLLELSNGVCCLAQIGDWKIRFLLCSLMLGCGGLCVTMQTAAAAGGLSIRRYLLGKGIQSLISGAICCGILWNFWAPSAALALIGRLYLGKKEKSSSNHRLFGV